jgi:ATP-dependent helicase YprA (DUF1998 family)
MWRVARLICSTEKEDSLRACLALSSRLEEAATAQLQELLQCCRDEEHGVKPACTYSQMPGYEVTHLLSCPLQA